MANPLFLPVPHQGGVSSTLEYNGNPLESFLGLKATYLPHSSNSLEETVYRLKLSQATGSMTVL